MQTNPVDRAQKAISDLEEAFLDALEVIGNERRIGEILSIPKELERFIKERLLLKGMITDRSGIKWKDKEDSDLIEEVISGKEVEEIAKLHNRSCYAIKKRIEKLNEEGRITS